MAGEVGISVWPNLGGHPQQLKCKMGLDKCNVVTVWLAAWKHELVRLTTARKTSSRSSNGRNSAPADARPGCACDVYALGGATAILHRLRLDRLMAEARLPHRWFETVFGGNTYYRTFRRLRNPPAAEAETSVARAAWLNTLRKNSSRPRTVYLRR